MKSYYLELIEDYALSSNDLVGSSWNSISKISKININKILNFFSNNAFFQLEFSNNTVIINLDMEEGEKQLEEEIFSEKNIEKFLENGDETIPDHIFTCLKNKLGLNSEGEESTKEYFKEFLKTVLISKLFHLKYNQTNILSFSPDCRDLFQYFYSPNFLKDKEFLP